MAIIHMGINMNELVHRGSVKDVYRYDEKQLLFRFSNRYSLFDWGSMPDEIPSKGEALATFSKELYCKLENPVFWQQNLMRETEVAKKLKLNGLKTHQRNVDCFKNEIVVDEVPCPRNDLDFYKNKPDNAFIPLEVIYRCGIPHGSSLLARYPERYQAGQELFAPLVECSTKWENTDRMIDWNEACELAGLSQNEKDELIEYTQCLALALKEFFKSRNLTLWDGKVEWAFTLSANGRSFMLVDSIGPDELRLSANDMALSKEFLRTWYRKTQWFSELKEAKQKFPNDFRKQCSAPEVLPGGLIADVALMYETLAKSIDEVQDLKSLCNRLERWL